MIKTIIIRLIDYLIYPDPKEGKSIINKIGHRDYIGGYWNDLGLLQFQFLLKMGLKPSHCLFDIGCGSLRGGIHFIEYLNRGKYVGIDKEEYLIKKGIEEELNHKTLKLKEPNFIISEKFNFRSSSQIPDFSIAQSLFTHLDINDINLCLNNLRKIVKKNHLFFVTFKEGSHILNRSKSNSFSVFFYSFKILRDLASKLGWRAEYIGAWGHPRNQKMLKLIAK
tara:strand:- start:206 stop:874 length:669 start_codon:yes stop_codon:yes gene_type:complete